MKSIEGWRRARLDMRRREVAWRFGRHAALSACVCSAIGLSAVEDANAQSRLVGSDYISRPLVLPRGVLRIDGGPRRPYDFGQVMPAGQLQFLINNEGDDAAFLVPGAGVGAIDNLELGAVWPLRISPDANLADLSVYGKYSLQRGTVEVAGFAEIRIPVEDVFELTGGLPVYVHLSGARIETGGFLRFRFGSDAAVVLHVPVSVPIQVSPEVFVGPEIGVDIYKFEDVGLPLGVIAGYTLGGGISSIGDLFARFALADITSGADTIRLDVGAEIFFDIF